MKAENKAIFDELMEIVEGLTENASRLHERVEYIQKNGNALARMECGKMLGEAKGAIDAASKLSTFAQGLIDA